MSKQQRAGRTQRQLIRLLLPVVVEEKLAVECGYWHNFRYNPAAEDKKFTLDSKAPTGDYQSFLKGEVRYASLALKNPDRAGALDAKNEEEAKARYQYLNKLVTLYTNN